MNSTRIKGSPDGAGCYHVMSRTVGGETQSIMLFGEHEKNVFAKQLRKHAEFAGVEVLTWCMMDNHFHLLIRIPEREELLAGLMADGREKFWKCLRALYSRERVKAVRDEVEKLERREKLDREAKRKPGAGKDGGTTTGVGTGGAADGGKARRAEEILERYLRRMGDLSSFVKGLKFAFSVWFNRKHGRRGTLWMERFKSVLLEGEPWVLNKVAAYIDLNPIRAGLVEDPGDYRWSGYGQAAGGKVEARRGLSAVYGYGRNEWRQIASEYRQLLYLEGVEVRDAEGKVLRTGVSEEDFYRETGKKGEEAVAKRFARRVAYFANGAAIGSREFLEAVFERNRGMFGPKRKTGARKFRGAQWKGEGMYSLRDLGAG